MAVKTITIDLDAYDLLSRHKKSGQSFSDVIKEHFGPKRTAAGLREALGRIHVAQETLEAIDRQVRTRREDKARAARI
ncbi:MAG TPA: antitoxin VapB family protein [Acidobacteriota bacterium]|jgi:predicted CopG family antitoxin